MKWAMGPRTGLLYDPGYSCEGRTRIPCPAIAVRVFLFAHLCKQACDVSK